MVLNGRFRAIKHTSKLDQDIFCLKVKEVERSASQEHVDEKGDIRVIFNGHFESWTVLESK